MIKEEDNEDIGIDGELESEGKEESVIEPNNQAESVPELTLEEQIVLLKDKYLRAEAEIQNVRKVAEQQITKARLYGLENFAKEIFSVGDNLERALESLSTNEDLKLAVEGIELTLKDYEKSLEVSGVTYINPLEEKFDPQKHQAITMVEDNNLEENTVKSVIQKGYLLYDRVLRPAMVVVSKKSDLENK